MARINAYPLRDPVLGDSVVGTKNPVTGVDTPKTAIFGIGDIIDLVPIPSFEAVTTFVAADFSAQQNPASVGVLHSLTLGPAQNTITDAIMVDAAGVVTVNKIGVYLFALQGLFGKLEGGQAGVIEFGVFVNGVEGGFSQTISLKDQGDMVPFNRTAVLNVVSEGTVVEFKMSRSSAGANAGCLVSNVDPDGFFTPTPNLAIIVSDLKNS